MLFSRLYELVCELDEPPVTFDHIRDLVNHHHAGVGIIKVWAISYPEPHGEAHYKMTGEDRTSPYEESFIEAEIRYCESLDETPAERKYCLTKELMHVFDKDNQRVDTRDKFMKLVRDIQNQPLPEHSGAAYTSEIDARWMALIILCPKKFRDRFKAEGLNEIEIATKLQIPEWVVPFILDDYYDEAHKELLEQ